MLSPNRIDVHHHLVPPFWAEALSRHGGDPSGWHSPAWSADTSLAFMDAQRIATAVRSLTAPSVTGWETASRREMARRVNEFGAELVARWPDRFGSFATCRSRTSRQRFASSNMLSTYSAQSGVVLHSNYAGHYLGDPAFGPLWSELDRRAAVVFIHPQSRKFLSLRTSLVLSSTIRSTRRAPPCSLC